MFICKLYSKLDALSDKTWNGLLCLINRQLFFNCQLKQNWRDRIILSEKIFSGTYHWAANGWLIWVCMRASSLHTAFKSDLNIWP